MMRIAIGADHRGFAVKSRLKELLDSLGHDVLDVGAHDAESSDYTDFAIAAAQEVGAARAQRAVLVCGSGIGMAIAANKVRGVRAGVCHDELSAEMSRRHNDLNVLCLASDLIGEKHAESLVKTWLETEFEGGRHARRVEKIARLEEKNCEPSDA